MRPRLDVLRLREFRLVFAAHAASVVGDFFVPVAIVFAVLDLTGSAGDVGLVLAANMLPSFAFLLLGGVFSDRLSPRPVMIGADVVRGAAQATLAALLLTGAAEVWHVVLLQLTRGTASAFAGPAASAMVPRVVPAERLQAANALMSLAASGAAVGAPAVAGVLVGALGPAYALAVDAATFAISAFFLLGVRSSAEPPPPREPLVAQLAAGWQAFSSRTWLVSVVALFALFNLVAYAPFMVLGPLLAERELGGAAAWGGVLAGGGVGAFVGGVVVLRIAPARPVRTSVIALAAYALPVVLLAEAAPAPALAVGAAVGGAGVTITNTLRDTTMQRLVPVNVLSRVSAYDWMAYAFAPLGYLLAATAAAAAGERAVLWSGGAVLVAACAVAAVSPAIGRVREEAGSLVGSPPKVRSP